MIFFVFSKRAYIRPNDNLYCQVPPRTTLESQLREIQHPIVDSEQTTARQMPDTKTKTKTRSGNEKPWLPRIMAMAEDLGNVIAWHLAVHSYFGRQKTYLDQSCLVNALHQPQSPFGLGFVDENW